MERGPRQGVCEDVLASDGKAKNQPHVQSRFRVFVAEDRVERMSFDEFLARRCVSWSLTRIRVYGLLMTTAAAATATLCLGPCFVFEYMNY